MRRILTAILSLYWAAAFAVAAAAHGGTAGPDGRPLADWSAAGELGVAAICVLAAALFVWLLLSVFFEDAAEPGQADAVASVAFGGAVVALAAALVAEPAAAGWNAGIPAAGTLAGLLASYLVVHVERRERRRPAESRPGRTRAAARLMALGAAHDTMLSRMATPIVPANDEWMR